MPTPCRCTACGGLARPFTIDENAVRDAAAWLGLKQPVYVQISAALYRSWGYYAGPKWQPVGARRRRWDSPHHVIVLSSHSLPERASQTLWHELAHALQSERHGHLEFLRLYSREAEALNVISARARQGNGFARYRSISFEREAQDHEPLAETNPLVQKGTS